METTKEEEQWLEKEGWERRKTASEHKGRNRDKDNEPFCLASEPTWMEHLPTLVC